MQRASSGAAAQRLTVNITIVGPNPTRGNESFLFHRSSNSTKSGVEFHHSILCNVLIFEWTETEKAGGQSLLTLGSLYLTMTQFGKKTPSIYRIVFFKSMRYLYPENTLLSYMYRISGDDSISPHSQNHPLRNYRNLQIPNKKCTEISYKYQHVYMKFHSAG